MSEVKRVYREIDKFSNLLAPLREESELYWKTRASTRVRRCKGGGAGGSSTNAAANAAAAITATTPETNLLDDSNAQLGYGEITSVSSSSYSSVLFFFIDLTLFALM